MLTSLPVALLPQLSQIETSQAPLPFVKVGIQVIFGYGLVFYFNLIL